jgi:hypothetical protein
VFESDKKMQKIILCNFETTAEAEGLEPDVKVVPHTPLYCCYPIMPII